MALHAQVRPDSIRALHQRMEDLLEDYRARYGGNSGSRDYDPISFLPLDPGGGPPRTRRLSSSRRRNSERQRELCVCVCVWLCEGLLICHCSLPLFHSHLSLPLPPSPSFLLIPFILVAVRPPSIHEREEGYVNELLALNLKELFQ